jgi:two-component sensor histidine kinase
MLDAQKFQETTIKPELATADLGGVTSNIQEQMAFLSAQKNVRLLIEVPPNTLVFANVGYLERVLTNLVSNAIKFSPLNGEVRLGVSPKGKMLEITVEDEGPGIPEEEQEEIFKPYKQLDAKKAGAAYSTGLGLSFCKMAVEAQGGEIGVDNSDKGTMFYFTLKAAAATQPLETVSGAVEGRNGKEQVNMPLSVVEKEYLAKFVEQLKGLEVYQASKIEELLKEIQPDKGGEALLAWRSQVERAVFHMNEHTYESLLNQAR